LEIGRAALFYERFYNCATAIKTGDYSLYLPPVTAEATAAPSLHATSLPSMAPSEQATALPDQTEIIASANLTDPSDNKTPNILSEQSTDFNATETTDVDPIIEDPQNSTQIDGSDVEQTNETRLLRTRFVTANAIHRDRTITEDELLESILTDAPPTKNEYINSTLDEISENDNNSTLDIDEEDVAEAAEKLQQAAVEAAENAANVASKNSSAVRAHNCFGLFPSSLFNTLSIHSISRQLRPTVLPLPKLPKKQPRRQQTQQLQHETKSHQRE
jgi:hypothetical protein